MGSFKKYHKELIKYDKPILKTQQGFRTEKHNISTEEFNKIALSSNDDKITQSIDSIETYAYGKNANLVCKAEEIKCNNIIKQYKKCLTLIISQKRTESKLAGNS